MASHCVLHLTVNGDPPRVEVRHVKRYLVGRFGGMWRLHNGLCEPLHSFTSFARRASCNHLSTLISGCRAKVSCLCFWFVCLSVHSALCIVCAQCVPTQCKAKNTSKGSTLSLQCIVCAQWVHCVHTVHALCAYSACIVCAQCVHYVCTLHAWCVHSAHGACTLRAQHRTPLCANTHLDHPRMWHISLSKIASRLHTH